MLDDLDIAFRHVAPDAVVRWIGMLPGHRRRTTAFVRVALHTLFGKVVRGNVATWFDMRIVAGNATHRSLTRAIALTECHRVIVFEMICMRRRFARRRDEQVRQPFPAWRARP